MYLFFILQISQMLLQGWDCGSSETIIPKSSTLTCGTEEEGFRPLTLPCSSCLSILWRFQSTEYTLLSEVSLSAQISDMPKKKTVTLGSFSKLLLIDLILQKERLKSVNTLGQILSQTIVCSKGPTLCPRPLYVLEAHWIFLKILYYAPSNHPSFSISFSPKGKDI